MNANEELRWLFFDSAAELGYKSTLGAQLDRLEEDRLAPGVYAQWKRDTREALRQQELPHLTHERAWEQVWGGCWINAPDGEGMRHGTNRNLGRMPATDAYASWLVPGWVSGEVPSSDQVYAASRQRWLLASFRKLKPRYQAAICIAYEPRHSGGRCQEEEEEDARAGRKVSDRNKDDMPALVSRFGIAANIVRRLLRNWDKSLRWAEKHKAKEIAAAVAVLAEAHHVWEDIRRDDRAAARRDRDEARQRGRLVSAAVLDRLTAEPDHAQLRKAAREWLDEVGYEDA